MTAPTARCPWNPACTWEAGCTLMAVLCIAALAASDVKAGEPARRIDFGREIRPILADKCMGCHSGEEPESGLRLGERTAVFGKGDTGRIVVVPGKPEESELVRRITSKDESQRMPPADEKPLTPEEISRLTQWIAEGAEWSAHWAFQPLFDPAPPPVQRSAWIRNGVDRFVLERLEQLKIDPSPEADHYTIIKRLYYRRGMYTFFKRTIPYPNLMTFDSPDANVACVERIVSNTPLQSLTLLHLFGLNHLKLTQRVNGLDARLTGVAGNVIADWVA